MKYKIKEVDKDSENNLTIQVEFTDGDRKERKTFNFYPTTPKEDILISINDGCPIAEKTPMEIEKETALEAIQTELESEKDKEVTVTEEIGVKEVK